MKVRAARVGDLAPGQSQRVEAEGRRIALFRVGNRYFAVDDVCPHRGGPLAEGAVEDGKVVCPWHAWAFDLKSGVCETAAETKIGTYPVRVEGGDIVILLKD